MSQTHARQFVSPSLIVTSPKPGVPKTDYKKFCLWLPDWCPCCISDKAERKNVSPCEGPEQQNRKSLKLKRTRSKKGVVLLQRK